MDMHARYYDEELYCLTSFLVLWCNADRPGKIAQVGLQAQVQPIRSGAQGHGYGHQLG